MGAGVEDTFGAAEPLGAGGVVVTTLGVDVTVGTVAVEAAVAPTADTVSSSPATGRGRSRPSARAVSGSRQRRVGWQPIALRRDEMSLQVRGIPYDGIDRGIDVHVSRLRRKLEAAGLDGASLKSVRGYGYLLVKR